MLVLSRKSGERVILEIGATRIVLAVGETKSSRVKLGIDAPPSVRVMRAELPTAEAPEIEPPPVVPIKSPKRRVSRCRYCHHP